MPLPRGGWAKSLSLKEKPKKTVQHCHWNRALFLSALDSALIKQYVTRE